MGAPFPALIGKHHSLGNNNLSLFFLSLGKFRYTKQSDISRARVWFFEGKRKIMLYTERAHFYHRYKVII